MTHALQNAELKKLLKLDCENTSALWYSITDYTTEWMRVELMGRLNQMLDRSQVLSSDNAVAKPRYRFTLVNITHGPLYILLEVVIPGDTRRQARLLGQIQLDCAFTDGAGLELSLKPELPAEKLSRLHNWRATPAELQAVDRLIEAAEALRALGSRHFPVTLVCSEQGVSIQTLYTNPFDQVRAPLNLAKKQPEGAMKDGCQ